MLVNRCSSIHPKVDADVKPRTIIQSDRRVPKLTVYVNLPGQLRDVLEPADDLPRIDPRMKGCFGERLHRYIREELFVIISFSPARLHQRTKLHKEIYIAALRRHLFSPRLSRQTVLEDYIPANRYTRSVSKIGVYLMLKPTWK